jgi:hypothetical protein
MICDEQRKSDCWKPNLPVSACFRMVACVCSVRKHSQGKSKRAVRVGMTSSLSEKRRTDAESDTPASAARGLHLRSTATQFLREERLLWFRRAMHQGLLTKAPTLSSVPDKERYSTASVLPRRGLPAGNPATQLERNL